MTPSTPAIPDKKWMKAPRGSREYMSGLELFIYFLIENRPNLGGADWYSCLCVKCRNRKGKNDLEHINEHLIINGFDTTYTTWIHHGEQFSRSYVNSQSSTLPTNNVEDPCPSLVSMVNDILEHLPNEVNVEDEVNVEAHVEATTFTCDNEGVNQTQTDLEENVKYKEKYNSYKENLNSRNQSQRGNRRTKKLIDYVSWLRQQLKNDEDSSFKKLVDGPSFKAISYKSCQVNGYVFCTSESEKHKMTQNSGGLIPIQFDDVGQPIGPNHKFVCTFIGETTKENLSPLVGDWRDLEEEEDKEYIRKVVAEKGRPKGSVKRSEIFLACHTKEDGTYPEEMKEPMGYSKDPMLMDKDLDNDAVAVEYGADGNGHVRGYNGHLNKTNIRVSAPLRRVIERERVKQVMLNDVQESLEVEANERRPLEKRVAAFESRESPRGAYMHRPFENNFSTSQISIELSETIDIYRTILVDKERNVENNKTLLECRPL
ncbi:hypothetical protein GIB67_031520 [Kingdonia uniflora]|uniref:Transposase-associated domain-containing protein n=1 Tax=Kingdonia uniflora TaxID=39325 RepID=A0A7J7MN76_9MAGN|nr:hypothetical protein GIB67_031520 [Kingdonia uniflora]